MTIIRNYFGVRARTSSHFVFHIYLAPLPYDRASVDVIEAVVSEGCAQGPYAGSICTLQGECWINRGHGGHLPCVVRQCFLSRKREYTCILANYFKHNSLLTAITAKKLDSLDIILYFMEMKPSVCALTEVRVVGRVNLQLYRGVHSMHIAYSPSITTKFINFLPLISANFLTFLPYFCSIYIFLLNLRFLLPPYFDHDA